MELALILPGEFALLLAMVALVEEVDVFAQYARPVQVRGGKAVEHLKNILTLVPGATSSGL